MVNSLRHDATREVDAVLHKDVTPALSKRAGWRGNNTHKHYEKRRARKRRYTKEGVTR